MRRLWGWYRARRWWAKTLIGAPLLLIAAAGLYVFVRWIQYAGLSSVTAGDYVPGSAQIVVRCAGLADRWAEISKGDAWRVINRRLLKEPLLRHAVNGALKEFKVPTLDQLEDRRFQERSGGWYSEDRILWIAGRDVMAALKVGNDVNQTHFCAATKMDFLMFLAEPFSMLLARLAGASTDTVGGTTCIRRGSMYVALDGIMAVAADDKALLGEALQRKGRGKAPGGVASVSVRFDGSQVLENAKRSLKTFPTGIVTTVADPGPMTRLELVGDVQGGDLILTATVEGVTPTSSNSAPTGPVKWAPATGGGALAVNIDAKPIWSWMESVANETRPPWNPLEQAGRATMRDAVKQLNLFKLPELVVPKMNGPLTAIYGTAPGSKESIFGVAAFVFKCDDPMAVLEAITKICRDAIGHSTDYGSWVRERYQGFECGYLNTQLQSFNIRDFKLPCMAVVEGHAVIANNLEFLRSVLDTAAGQAGAMVDDEYFRFAKKRLDKAGLKRVLGEGLVVSGYFNGPSIRDGLDGYYPLWAYAATSNDEITRKFLAEVRAEFQKEGRPPDTQAIGKIVLERIDALKTATEMSYRDAGRLLECLAYAAFEAEAVPNAIKARAVMGLKMQ